MAFRTITSLVLLLCVAYPWNAVLSQGTEAIDRAWSCAANNWQRAPVDIAKQKDTVSPEVRAKRNAFWKRPMMRSALTAVPLPGIADDRGPEIRVDSGSPTVWLVAKFESFHVYAIDEEKTELYTEINLRVIRVIHSSANIDIPVGSLIDIAIPGGAITNEQGATHSSALKPRSFAFQPGHIYLLDLLYNSTYDVFTSDQRWDVTSGSVLPDDGAEIKRAQDGRSKLAGMSVEDASKYIQSVLKAQSGK